MANPYIEELQNAAMIIMAAPNVVTREQRQSAESVFMNFRKTKAPYNLCREILENSTVDLVLFESAIRLKDALICEWSSLAEDDIRSLRQYLLQYITHRDIPVFVRDRILQLIAIIVKRGCMEDFGFERASIITEIEGLIMSGNHKQQILGCGLLAALLTEHTSTVRSADVGLPWEQHLRAKKSLEAMEMPRVFRFLTTALAGILESGRLSESTVGEETLTLMNQLLKLMETILTWGYVSPLLPKFIYGMFETLHESDQSPALRLGPAWRELILSTEIPRLFFTLYWHVRSHDSLAHHAMICIVQLATLTGAVFERDDQRLSYITGYLEAFFNFLENAELKPRETLGVANIIRKIMVLYLPKLLCRLPVDLIRRLIAQTATFTCNLMRAAAHEESIYADDRVYTEAFDTVLEAWATVILHRSLFPPDLIEPLAREMFNIYIQSHLLPPDGTRGTGNDLDNEEIDETEEPDRVRFADQLSIIGSLGQVVIGHSLDLLERLLNVRTEELTQLFRRLSEGSVQGIADRTRTYALFDDLLWIIMVSGHVICMDFEGETPLIPKEIIQHCMTVERSNPAVDPLLDAPVNLTALLEGGVGPEVDPVLRLAVSVFKLCETHRLAAVDVKLRQEISPELMSTLIWFLGRFATVYVMPNEDMYNELPSGILKAFGRDTEGARWAVNFILATVHSNFYHFESEISLLTESVQLLISLVARIGERSVMITNSPTFSLLSSMHASYTPGRLQGPVRRSLSKVLTMAASGLPRDNCVSLLREVVGPSVATLRSKLSTEDFSRTYQQEDVRAAVTDAFEQMIGIVSGVKMDTASIVIEFIGGILSEVPQVINVYHNYQIIVQLCLELLITVTNCMLTRVKPADCKEIYKCCSASIQAYTWFNSNKATVDTTAEEGNFQDLMYLLEIISNVANRIDESEEDNCTSHEVCIRGLDAMLRLLTPELLRYPPLCAKFYELLVLLAEFYTEKLCDMPDELSCKTLECIQHGLVSCGADVLHSCFVFIERIANHIYSQDARGTWMYTALPPLMKTITELTMSHEIPSTTVFIASETLFRLITLYPEHFRQLVGTLVSGQVDSTNAERLATAFTDLTTGVEFNGERPNKMKFKDKYDKFLTNVHGFLIVK